jgi:hypothetical protein
MVRSGCRQQATIEDNNTSETPQGMWQYSSAILPCTDVKNFETENSHGDKLRLNRLRCIQAQEY